MFQQAAVVETMVAIGADRCMGKHAHAEQDRWSQYAAGMLENGHFVLVARSRCPAAACVAHTESCAHISAKQHKADPLASAQVLTLAHRVVGNCKLLLRAKLLAQCDADSACFDTPALLLSRLHKWPWQGSCAVGGRVPYLTRSGKPGSSCALMTKKHSHPARSSGCLAVLSLLLRCTCQNKSCTAQMHGCIVTHDHTRAHHGTLLPCQYNNRQQAGHVLHLQ